MAVQSGASERGERTVWSQELLFQLILLTIGGIVAFPIVIAFLTSFKPAQDVIRFPPQPIPSVWTVENYITAWTATPFDRYLFNSFIQTGIITTFQVLFSLLAAYAFAFLSFPGRDRLFYIVLGSLMVPFELVFIPNFMTISQWGWGNTYQGLTVPFLASAFGVFLLRQFFLTVPRDLHDAARIDGANNWRFLWQIIVPLSKGSIGAFSIFAFLSAWNQYLWPLVITDETNMRTIQIGIRYFTENVERQTDWGAVMAGSIIALAPTMVAFLLAQKQLVQGIAMTGLKG